MPFFLSPAQVDLALAAGRRGPELEYVLAVTDTLRELRLSEVRDIRAADAATRARLAQEATTARTELNKAKAMCSSLMEAVQRAVDPKALAELRRKVAPRPS